ncbi:MAG: DegQ family serine endoprotease [Deltaproteobacteria bacterium]
MTRHRLMVFAGCLLAVSACSPGGTGSSTSSQDPASLQQAFVGAVDRAVPAVVNIRTVTRYPLGGRAGSRPGRGEIQDYLLDMLEENGGFREDSLGSGVIVGENGLIVTNEHVIRDADEIVVRLADRSEYRARVVGADPRTDIALLRIQTSRKLPVAVLGDSSRIRVGEWAIAVGNPFGLESTVTVGVVSATGRTELGSDAGSEFIQTDASINPGNSGGPLLNTRGEVIGINSAMMSAGQGIGFAIPINTVLAIEQELARSGTIRRGWLGVGIQPLTADLAESFGVRGESGILVNRIFPDSPAAAAGLRGGDIVIGFQGARVTGLKEFQKRVAALAPGTPVTLEILRDGKRSTLRATLAEQEVPAPRRTVRKAPLDAWGLQVTEIPADILRGLGIEGGVEVTAVDPSGVAGAGGVREGDVLVRINREPVAGVDGYRKMLAKLPRGRMVSVLVLRERGQMYLAFRNKGR